MVKVVPATHLAAATSMARTRARLGPMGSAVGTLINANVGTPVQTSVHLSMELRVLVLSGYAVDDLTCATFQWGLSGLSHTMLFTESTQFALTCQLLNPSNAAPVHSLQSSSLLHGLSPPYSIGSSTDICLDQARVCGFISLTERQKSIRSFTQRAWMVATNYQVQWRPW